jgi:predicted transcriptional regulator
VKSTQNTTLRKSKQDISVAILKITKSGANKTRIVYKTNLNFVLADKYLDFLQQNGLVEAKYDSTYYQITEKGQDYLNKMQDINTNV